PQTPSSSPPITTSCLAPSAASVPPARPGAWAPAIPLSASAAAECCRNSLRLDRGIRGHILTSRCTLLLAESRGHFYEPRPPLSIRIETRGTPKRTKTPALLR